jgi:hypothetical protein
MMHRVVQQITALRLLVAEDLKKRIAVSANVDRVWHDHAPHSMPRVCMLSCYIHPTPLVGSIYSDSPIRSTR